MPQVKPTCDRILLTPLAETDMSPMPASSMDQMTRMLAYTVLEIGPDVRDKRIQAGKVVYCTYADAMMINDQMIHCCPEHSVHLILE